MTTVPVDAAGHLGSQGWAAIARRLPPGAARTQRTIALIVVVAPVLGLIVAGALAWGRGLDPVDLGILAGLYLFTGFGITVGFHRLFTHQSFQAAEWVRALLAVGGCMALQGPVLTWVADHRRHHAYSDREGDPHSPHRGGVEGYRAALRGLWHAHVGWFFDTERTIVRRFAPDLLDDALLRRIDRLYALWAALTLIVPPVLGLLIGGTARSALTALLWGGFVRLFLVHHVTWSINSICHFFGSRPFDTNDKSTNNWLLAVPSLGEAWHNNHHAFPGCAFAGLARGEIDISGWLVRGLEALGLAWNVKRVSESRVLLRSSGERRAAP
jgi:stearoyl-CoA desaturase (delta-9 desaturase)